MALGLAIAIAIWGLPDQGISLGSVSLGLATSALAGALYFLLCACLEMVAFWQDAVWNLLIMLRMISSFLGGLMVPLAFFPQWGQEAVGWTPFPLIFGFPIRCFLGQVGWQEWARSTGLLFSWIVAFGALASWIWSRAPSVSGVGI